MARPLRIQYPGAVYHVTCRGNEKKDIFKGDADRARFLRILQESMNIYGIKLCSYVLMADHFHFLLQTPLGNLGEFMRHFNITYTSYYNRHHKRVGHLYQGRYKSILVDKDTYLSILSRYIHLNPIRIKPLRELSPEEKIKYLLRYRWSSLPGYLRKREKQPFIDYSMVLAEYGGDTDRAREGYRKNLFSEITQGREVKGGIIGQSLLGGREFITWVKETFIKGEKDRESPAHRALQRYRSSEDIFKAIERETGKGVEQLKAEKGALRRMAMELLYRVGGLTGPEIGKIFGIDYSSVSQERKRLREDLEKKRKLKLLLDRIEMWMSTPKN